MGKTDAVQDDLATCIFIKSLRHHHSSPVCHDTSRHSNMCECHRRYRNSSSASSSSSTSTPNLASSKSTTNGFNNNHNKQALKEKLMASDKNAKNFSLSSNRYKNYKGSPKWKMDGRRKSTSTESVASSRSEKSDKEKETEQEYDQV
ncbi:vitellogenin-1-like [Homarus americanus]|uniref:vitellogenin-1-like n=1 Tax=Homarus americanus TaxID=6706 RepID=UPI001C47EC75|nr:vitellogenin-1-like [Homarus americanus]